MRLGPAMSEDGVYAHIMLIAPLYPRPTLGNSLAIDVAGETRPALKHQMRPVPLVLRERHLRLTDPKVGACSDSALGNANVIETPAVIAHPYPHVLDRLSWIRLQPDKMVFFLD